MKKLKNYFTISALCLLLGTGSIYAQELPRPSSSASVEQRIGLTDVTVKYSRPNVKERKIWGGLVPYNEVWRTGANEATTITLSDEVTINGQKLAAGTYAMFTTPTESNWKVHFNKAVESWGTGNYSANGNVLNLDIKPGNGPKVESMRFTFENVEGNKGDLVLAWDQLTLTIPIETEVDSKAWANIDKAMSEAKEEDKWSVYRNAASYCVASNKKLDQGLEWIEKSIELKESWYSYWVKADVLAAQKDNKAAIASAKKAIKLGEEEAKKDGKEFQYKSVLEGKIEEWKKNI